MRIEFQRQGGFANIPLKTTIDVDQLPPDEGERFRELVRAADFFTLSPVIAAPAAPDRFHYTLTVQEGEKRHTVRVDEAAVPAPLKALIQAVTARLRSVGTGSTG